MKRRRKGNMFMFSKRLTPELNYFSGHEEPHEVLQQVAGTRRAILMIFLFVLSILVVVWVARNSLARLLGFPGGVVQAVVQPLAMLVGFYVLFNHGFRRPFQRALRRRLREKGVLLCLACGYDLRGQEQDRCPECGEAFSRIAGSKTDSEQDAGGAQSTANKDS